MAMRTGSFSGQTFEWNAPLSIVHPPDNIIMGSQYHPTLRAKMNQYTEEQLRDLEEQIRELESVMRIDRDWQNWP